MPAPVAQTEHRRRPRAGAVALEVCEDIGPLRRAHAPLAPGLRYAAELRALWNLRDEDPDRFVTQGILAVAVATVRGRVAGWGELLVARPDPGEARSDRGACRVSRLDVAPAFRRRAFADARTGQPISELLLRSLLGAAPYGTDVLAEVTPDAENLFEQAGFTLLSSGRWRYAR